jgi:hypothetical protein
MCGNKHSLKYLRDLGYRTFNGFIDETYDGLDTWDRYDAIVKEIFKIKNMTQSQRLEWFMSMKDLLDYNFEVLKDNTTTVLPSSVLKIQNHVG